MSIIVTLTPEQVRWAREVGTTRHIESQKRKSNPRFAYTKRSSEESHQIGALGELAGAVGIGLEWLGRINTFHEYPDIDPYWEVRWSGNPKRNKSAPSDKPDQLILHVTGRDPTFEVHGFILAGWVQRNFPLTDPNDSGAPAHFFPTHLLTPIDENFHAVCAWMTTPERGWHCEYCGKQYDGPIPDELHQPVAGGRPAEEPATAGSDVPHPLP